MLKMQMFVELLSQLDSVKVFIFQQLWPEKPNSKFSFSPWRELYSNHETNHMEKITIVHVVPNISLLIV